MRKASRCIFANRAAAWIIYKRQCSIILCIRAQGAQGIRPALVFRGAGQRLSTAERLAYSVLDTIAVYFQPNAWVDSAVMSSWLAQFSEDLYDLDIDECVLGQDQHGPHMLQAFQTAMRASGIEPVFTPSACTDIVAPVDHHVGKRLKDLIALHYHACMEVEPDAWCKSPTEGGLHEWERRVYMATWLAAAWEELRSDADFFRPGYNITKKEVKNT